MENLIEEATSIEVKIYRSGACMARGLDSCELTGFIADANEFLYIPDLLEYSLGDDEVTINFINYLQDNYEDVIHRKLFDRVIRRINKLKGELG